MRLLSHMTLLQEVPEQFTTYEKGLRKSLGEGRGEKIHPAQKPDPAHQHKSFTANVELSCPNPRLVSMGFKFSNHSICRVGTFGCCFDFAGDQCLFTYPFFFHTGWISLNKDWLIRMACKQDWVISRRLRSFSRNVT